MSRKVYIHIGLEKTGSTAFQSICQANADYFKSLRFLYPQSCLQSNQHGNLARAYKKEIKLPWAEISRLKRDLMEEIEQFDGSVILSAEEFSWLNRGEIAELKLFVEHYDVKILVVLRNQIDYINSLYAEHVRWSNSPASFRDFCLLMSHKMDFDLLLSDWSYVFPNCVELIVYNKSTATHDLLQKIGVDMKSGGTFNIHEIHHPTLPPELVEIQSILANNREGRLFQEELWKCFCRARDSGIDFKKFWRMPIEFQERFKSYESGNNNIAKNFGIDGPLFGDSILDYYYNTARGGHDPNPIAAIALYTFLKG